MDWRWAIVKPEDNRVNTEEEETCSCLWMISYLCSLEKGNSCGAQCFVLVLKCFSERAFHSKYFQRYKNDSFLPLKSSHWKLIVMSVHIVMSIFSFEKKTSECKNKMFVLFQDAFWSCKGEGQFAMVHRSTPALIYPQSNREIQSCSKMCLSEDNLIMWQFLLNMVFLWIASRKDNITNTPMKILSPLDPGYKWLLIPDTSCLVPVLCFSHSWYLLLSAEVSREAFQKPDGIFNALISGRLGKIQNQSSAFLWYFSQNSSPITVTKYCPVFC